MYNLFRGVIVLIFLNILLPNTALSDMKFKPNLLQVADFGEKVINSCFGELFKKYEGRGRTYDIFDDHIADCFNGLKDNGEVTPDYIIDGSVNYVLHDLSSQLIKATHLENHQFFKLNFQTFARACIGLFVQLEQSASVNLQETDFYERLKKRQAGICAQYGLGKRSKYSLAIYYAYSRAYGYPINLQNQFASELEQISYQQYGSTPKIRKTLRVYAAKHYARGLLNYNRIDGFNLWFTRGYHSEFWQSFWRSSSLSESLGLEHINSFVLAKSFDIATQFGDEEIREVTKKKLNEKILKTISKTDWLLWKVVSSSFYFLIFIFLCIYILCLKYRWQNSITENWLSVFLSPISSFYKSNVNLFKSLITESEIITIRERILIFLIPLIISLGWQSVEEIKKQKFNIKQSEYKSFGNM